MQTMNNTRKMNIDFLRIFACFFVILAHASSILTIDVDFTNPTNAISQVLSSLGHTGTILFFFISGSLLLSPDYDFKPGKFYQNNFLRLLIAYISWVVIYHLIGVFKAGIYTPAHIKEVILSIIRGEAGYHFWYLPMLLGIYLLLPFLRAICEKGKHLIFYFVALFLFVQVLFPTLCFFDFPYKYLLQSVISRIPLTLVNHHVGYFILGYFLTLLLKENYIRRPRLWGVTLTISGLVCGLLGEILLTLQQGIHTVTFSSLFSATLCMTACGIFLLFQSWEPRNTRYNDTIFKISKLTFGVYMLHPQILWWLLDAFPQTIQDFGVLSILIMTVVSFAICLIISWVLCLIPPIRKWVFYA